MKRLKHVTFRQPKSVSFIKWLNLMKELCDTEVMVERLQDDLEAKNLQIKDMELEAERFQAEIDRLKGSNKAKFDELNRETVRNLADRESRIVSLTADIKNLQDNYKYATDHIRDLNVTIRKANAMLEEFRQGKVNDEHMAKKLVVLQQENTKLKSEKEQTDAKFDTVCCPYQRSRGSKPAGLHFTSHLPCGKCTACKLEAAEGIIQRSAENVQRLEDEIFQVESEHKITKCVLDQTTRDIIKLNATADETVKKLAIATTDVKLMAEEKVRMDSLTYALEDEKSKLKEIIRLQNDALRDIVNNFFGRKNRAEKTLKFIVGYKNKHNLL